MSDYEQYEKECKKIRKVNKRLLADFRACLQEANLSPKTIDSHCSNIDFYLDEFLLYEDALEAREGVHYVDMFLGYWFIKKAMWASSANVNAYATSLNKFYTFMHSRKLIDGESLANLKQTIKERKPEWLATLARYDDPSVEDVWE